MSPYSQFFTSYEIISLPFDEVFLVGYFWIFAPFLYQLRYVPAAKEERFSRATKRLMPGYQPSLWMHSFFTDFFENILFKSGQRARKNPQRALKDNDLQLEFIWYEPGIPYASNHRK